MSEGVTSLWERRKTLLSMAVGAMGVVTMAVTVFYGGLNKFWTMERSIELIEQDLKREVWLLQQELKEMEIIARANHDDIIWLKAK
jgi:hypothetical protein